MDRVKILQEFKICRFCLTSDGELVNLFEKISPNFLPLPLQIMASIGLEVIANDGMPRYICRLCCSHTVQAYTFKTNCKKAEDTLKTFLSEGKLENPVMKSFEIEEQQGLSHYFGKNPSPPPQLSGPSSNSVAVKRPCYEPEPQPKRIKVLNSEILFNQVKNEPPKTEQHKNQSILQLRLEGSEITEPILNSLGCRKRYQRKKSACCLCLKASGFLSTLTSHFAMDHPRPFGCDLCVSDGKVFETNELAQLHFHQLHVHQYGIGTKFRCGSCTTLFSTSRQLGMHQEKLLYYCNIMKFQKKDYYFKCNHCDLKYQKESLLLFHLNKRHSRLDCNYCNKIFNSRLALNEHLLVHSDCDYLLSKAKEKSFVQFEHYVKLHLLRSSDVSDETPMIEEVLVPGKVEEVLVNEAVPENVEEEAENYEDEAENVEEEANKVEEVFVNEEDIVMREDELPASDDNNDPIGTEENFGLDSKDDIDVIEVEEMPLMEQKPDSRIEFTQQTSAEDEVSSTSAHEVINLQPSLMPDLNFTLKKLGLTNKSVKAMATNDIINLTVDGKTVKVKKVVIPKSKFAVKTKPGSQQTNNGVVIVNQKMFDAALGLPSTSNTMNVNSNEIYELSD